jgi:hypothetical protein
MKRWYQSKTMWLHIGTATVGMAGVGLQYVGAIGLTPTEQAIAALALTGLQAGVGGYLRTITTSAIK